MTGIENLGLPGGVLRKLSPPATTIEHLTALSPLALATTFKITPNQWEVINARLRACGRPELGDYPEKVAQATAMKGRCKTKVEGHLCGRKNLPSKQSCEWHWLARQPIADQLVAADRRRERHTGPERARVPKAEWPPGERWCGDCQGYVPLFYCQGSRCHAHASRAAHASMIKRVYDFTPADYEALLAWQNGRCYICRQLPRRRRLAVDHDHRTLAVRGLLCANDEWGCNTTLARLVNDPAMARRALAYAEKPPLARMYDGEPSIVRDLFADFD